MAQPIDPGPDAIGVELAFGVAIVEDDDAKPARPVGDAVEADGTQAHASADASAGEEPARDAEAGFVDFDSSKFCVHHADADGIFFAGLQAQVILGEDALGDIVGVEVGAPIERGAIVAVSVGTAEGVGGPFSVGLADIGGEEDGLGEPGDGFSLVSAAQEEEIGDFGLAGVDLEGEAFVVVAIALAGGEVSFAVDVFDGHPAPEDAVVVAEEIGEVHGDMVGLGPEICAAPAAAGAVVHPAFFSFFDRFFAMNALEECLAQDAVEVPLFEEGFAMAEFHVVLLKFLVAGGDAAIGGGAMRAGHFEDVHGAFGVLARDGAADDFAFGIADEELRLAHIDEEPAFG